MARVRAVRAILVSGAVLRAVAWGVATLLAIVVLLALVDLGVPLDVGARKAWSIVALIAGGVVAASLLWRDRAVRSLPHVALWIEEHFPILEYALVTGVETGDNALLARVNAAPWTARASRRVLRAVGVPVAVVAIAAIGMLLLPSGAVARVRTPHAGDALDRAGTRAPAVSRLSPLVVGVRPPTYSGEQATTVDEPTGLRALAGSVLTIRGRGAASGIVAHIGADSVIATATGDRWAIELRVGQRPMAVQLDDRSFRRVLAVEAIADNAPTVTLVTPAHDSVLRVPRGRIPLAADATDDFGIASASFEYIVSSGEGETFTFKSGTIGGVRPNSRTASWKSSLSIDSLGLKPGDIVHLRAVARDANDVSGPGLGVSETRAIRIARADEYDSVSVDAVAPSDADKSVISERMLIMLAEALEQKRPSMARPTLVEESRAIAADQKKLRRSVGDLIFTRLGSDAAGEEHSGDEPPERAKSMEAMIARADSATNRSMDAIDFEGGESPVVAVNKPLLEAYNAMWDASGSLEIGEPARALPFMRLALAAIQKARAAERLYLRGTTPLVVIDIDKARLKGKDKGASSLRRAAPVDSAARAREDRFLRIVELAGRDTRAAADSLLLLRLDALGENAPFAAAVGDAATAIRRGRSADATAALARARRALAGPVTSRDSLTRWGVVP